MHRDIIFVQKKGKVWSFEVLPKIFVEFCVSLSPRYPTRSCMLSAGKSWSFYTTYSWCWWFNLPWLDPVEHQPYLFPFHSPREKFDLAFRSNATIEYQITLGVRVISKRKESTCTFSSITDTQFRMCSSLTWWNNQYNERCFLGTMCCIYFIVLFQLCFQFKASLFGIGTSRLREYIAD